jgi:hypothetical protein
MTDSHGNDVLNRITDGSVVLTSIVLVAGYMVSDAISFEFAVLAHLSLVSILLAGIYTNVT